MGHKKSIKRIAYTVDEALATGTFPSRNKYYSAVASGDLRTYKDGKRRMVTDQAIAEYIQLMERRTAEGRFAHLPPVPRRKAAA